MRTMRTRSAFGNSNNSDATADDSVSGTPETEERTDEIATTARRVLADLGRFFDPELCGSGSDADESDGNQSSAISLEELSVVVNASIQRHQPLGGRVDATALTVQETRHHRAQCDEQLPDPNGKPDPKSHSRLPFAPFLELRKQKAQLFYEQRRDLRRSPVRRHARKSVTTLRDQRWRAHESRSSADSYSAPSSSEEPEEPSSDEESGEEDTEHSPVASLRLEDDGDAAAASGPQASARWLAASALGTRNAVTQATWMQDQGQQTSVTKRQQEETGTPTPPRTVRGSRRSERSEAASDVSEHGRKLASASTRQALGGKQLSLPLARSCGALVEPQSPPSAPFASSSTSSKRSFVVDSRELERVAPVHFSSTTAERTQAPAASLPEVRTCRSLRSETGVSDVSEDPSRAEPHSPSLLHTRSLAHCTTHTR